MIREDMQEAYERMMSRQPSQVRRGQRRRIGGEFFPPPSDKHKEEIEALQKLEISRNEKRLLNELSDENVKNLGSQLDEINNEIRKLLLKREVLENALGNFKKEINSKFDKENPSYQPKIAELLKRERRGYSPITIDLSAYETMKELKKITPDIGLGEIDSF
jgi:predicted transcriptional regulator